MEEVDKIGETSTSVLLSILKKTNSRTGMSVKATNVKRFLGKAAMDQWRKLHNCRLESGLQLRKWIIYLMMKLIAKEF